MFDLELRTFQRHSAPLLVNLSVDRWRSGSSLSIGGAADLMMRNNYVIDDEC